MREVNPDVYFSKAIGVPINSTGIKWLSSNNQSSIANHKLTCALTQGYPETVTIGDDNHNAPLMEPGQLFHFIVVIDSVVDIDLLTIRSGDSEWAISNDNIQVGTWQGSFMVPSDEQELSFAIDINPVYNSLNGVLVLSKLSLRY